MGMIHLIKTAIVFISTFTLTGCPGIGDRLIPDETASVTMLNHSVCFQVDDAEDYQPVFLAINLRSTPMKERSFIKDVTLKIQKNKLCIPPSVYQFSYGQQYIVEYVLTSQKWWNDPRGVVVGLEVSEGNAHRIRLTTYETSGPQDF